MAYVIPRADQTAYSSVDGVDPAFATAVEASSSGFGVKHANGTFEVLDALPLGRQAAQLAVEAGSVATAAITGAGFTAVDFAAADYITAGEVTASAGKIKSSYVTSDLT